MRVECLFSIIQVPRKFLRALLGSTFSSYKSGRHLWTCFQSTFSFSRTSFWRKTSRINTRLFSGVQSYFNLFVLPIIECLGHLPFVLPIKPGLDRPQPLNAFVLPCCPFASHLSTFWSRPILMCPFAFRLPLFWPRPELFENL